MKIIGKGPNNLTSFLVYKAMEYYSYIHSYYSYGIIHSYIHEY